MKKKLLLILIMYCSIATYAQTVPSYIPTTGLIGWWPFNANANDESGHGHNGNVIGATLFADRYGIGSSAYFFNGVNGHIDIDDSVALRLDSTDYTISAWVYSNSYSNQYFISKRGSGSQNGYAFINNNTAAGVSKVAMVFSQPETDSIAYSGTVATSSWHSIIITYNTTSQILRFYVDGVFSDSTLNIPTPSATCTANMRFGGDLLTNSHWHSGRLDDIGIWNRELTFTEIQGVFNATTGINEHADNGTLFNFYPNPNNGIFTVTTSQKNKNKIVVYDVLGNILKQYEMNDDRFTVDISDQPKGMYFVKIQTGKESITKKMVKQ